MKNVGKARAEDVKICERCGEMIIGEYDYVQTRRHTKLYFHKGMKCRRRKEDAEKVKPKKKTAGDIIEPYVKQGLTDSEIAEKTGIKYGTVWAAAKKIRERLAETKGKNADRHLCKTCKYRAATYNQKNSGIKCEYALKSGTKRSRGCDVEDCDKYEKGAPVKVKEEP